MEMGWFENYLFYMCSRGGEYREVTKFRYYIRLNKTQVASFVGKSMMNSLDEKGLLLSLDFGVISFVVSDNMFRILTSVVLDR